MRYKAHFLEHQSWRLSYIVEYKADRRSAIRLLGLKLWYDHGYDGKRCKKKSQNDIFQWNAKNGVTALQLTVDSFDKPKIENPSQIFIYK